MILDEAKHVIRNDSGEFSQWVFAAGVLTSSPQSTLDDLLVCLKRRGLPSEMAATTLYVRTKRPRRDDSVASIVLDHNDWADYIRHHS